MSGEQFVLERRQGQVAVVTLNEPEARNPLSPQLVRDVTAVLQRLASDPDVRVVVLTGAGRGFCAGADLRRMRSASPLEDRDEYDEILILNRLLWGYPKPTISAVHGFAMGAGANLMSWCDMALVEEDARIGYPEVKAGVPSATVIPTLMRTVGRKRMFELVLTGLPIPPEEAAAIGLVNRVVPRGTVVEAAMTLAGQIAEHHPQAVRFTKEIIKTTTDMSFDQSLTYAKDLRVISRLRDDFKVEISQGGSSTQ